MFLVLLHLETAGPAQLVEGAIAVLCHSPSGAHSIGDLLITVASKDRGKDRPAVITALLTALRSATAVLPDAPPAATATADGASNSQQTTETPVPPQHSSAALTVSRLLLLLTTLDASSAEEASTQGAAEVCLAALEAWMAGYTAGVQSLGQALTDPNESERVRIALQVSSGLFGDCGWKLHYVFGIFVNECRNITSNHVGDLGALGICAIEHFTFSFTGGI